MFTSSTLKSYGESLKKLRINLDLTREKVSSLTGINKDTIRRIEKSETIPRFETLELLSDCYKIDLLSLLNTHKQNPTLISILNKLDFIINNNDVEKLKEQIASFNKELDNLKDTLINYIELSQFKDYLKVIEIYFLDDKKDYSALTLHLINILRVTNEDFNIKNFKTFNYSFLELRVLFTLSTVLIMDDKCEDSIDILLYINENLSNFVFDSKFLMQMQTRIYSNLASCYYILEDDKTTLDYCNLGIDYCLKNDIMTNLHILFFRKAVALHFLEDKNSKQYFEKTINLLSLKNNEEQVKSYLSYSKNYGYDLDYLVENLKENDN